MSVPFRPTKLACVLGLLVLILSLAPAAFAQSAEGDWEGAIELPGRKFPLKLQIKRAAAGLEGTIDGPGGILPLKQLRLEAGEVKFDVDSPQGTASFAGKLEGDKLNGTVGLAGQSFPFTAERKASAAAAPKLPEGMIPREILFGNPDRAGPQLSPDGTKLGYLAPHNGVLNVFVRTVGQNDDRVITSDKKRGVRGFSWQYDSQHVRYMQDRDGDENFHFYQTNLTTKVTRDLTPFEGARVQGIWGEPKFPDVALVGINARDPKVFDVYRINLKTGALELDTQNPGDVNGWTLDHELQVRVAHVATPDGGQLIRIRDNAKAPWRDFQKWGPEDSFGGVIGFTPDNKGVRVITSVGTNTYRLIEMDIASGKTTTIAEDPQYDVGGAMVHPITKKLQAVNFARARRDWKILDSSIQADFDAIRKIRDGDIGVGGRDLADKTWLVSFLEDDGPVYFYAFERATKKATFLFTHQPQLEKYKLAEMKPISFESRDGKVIHGYLTLPAGGGKNLPMVLNVHGGPWGRDMWGFHPEAQWLANRGYAVLQVNFRGSTGYGKAFVNAGDREWGAKMHDDLLDGKKWAVQQGYADPKKICIYGGSYGGYATLVGVTFTPDEFICGVDIVGPSNIITLIKTIPPYWAPMIAIFKKRVGDPDKDEEFLKSRSPLFKADQIKAPLLIAQGANDPRVKQAESDQIVAAMRKNSKPVEYYVFPDEGHGFARPENRLAFYAAAEQFLAKHLGGTAQPPSATEAKLLGSIKK